MKLPFFFLRSYLLSALLIWMAPYGGQRAAAATVTWDAELNSSFWGGLQIVPSTRSNWSNQDFPGTSDEARFDDVSLINAVRDIDLETDRTVSSLSFDSATAGYTLDTSADRNQLTLGSGAISVTDGTHTIHSNVVLGADGNWSINGGDSLAVSGQVSGGFTLTKPGGGTLTLSGANSYGGSTIISSGILQLDGDNVIPDTSPVSLVGTLALNGRTDSIHSLAGPGTLNLNAGTLTLLNTSSFDGQMNVAGTGTSTFVVPSGVTYTHNNIGGGAANDIANVNPDTVTLAYLVQNGGSAVIEVPINTGQGTGNLLKFGGGSLSLLNDSSGYRGATLIDHGTLVISSVTDAVQGNTSSIGNGSFDNRLRIGSASAPGFLVFDGTTANGTTDRLVQLGKGGSYIEVTQASETLTLNGVISFDTEATSLVKRGPGTLKLTAANTYGDGTAINEGTLVVANSSGSATGAGNVWVESGATLAGDGAIGGEVRVREGASLVPGTGVGTLTVNNRIDLYGTYRCEIDGANADRLNANLALWTYGSTVIDFDVLGAPTEPVYTIASSPVVHHRLGQPLPSLVDVPSGYGVNFTDTAILLVELLPVSGPAGHDFRVGDDLTQRELIDLSTIIPGTTSWSWVSNSNPELVRISLSQATGLVNLIFNSDTADGTATLTFRGENAQGQYGLYTVTVTMTGPIYVDDSATGANDGSSWADACISPQNALAAAESGDEIWVAQGIYVPGTTRDATFQLVEGVELYGGFTGAETARSQRNPDDNPTILSGDVDGNDIGEGGVAGVPADVLGANAYHVVSATGGLTGATRIDGFVITGGQANGSVASEQNGGGLYCVSSTPFVVNCRFSGHHAQNLGGAVYAEGVSGQLLSLWACRISGNTAVGGAGVAASGSRVTLVDSAIHGNRANLGGGTAAFTGSTLTLTSCTVSGNKALISGGGIYCTSSALTTINTLVWGNQGGSPSSVEFSGAGAPSYEYSLIQGTSPGGTNFAGSADPGFVSPVDLTSVPTSGGDLRLAPGSGLIDQGNKAQLSLDIADLDGDGNGFESLSLDLDGLPRVMGNEVDPGAYELRPVVYVDADVVGGAGDGSSWDDAFPFLQDALDAFGTGAEIRVAGGTYRPDDGTTATDNDPASVFRMANHVALYGGYAGSGAPSPDERDPAAYPTILSGDLEGNDTDVPVGANASHVVAAEGVGRSGILDGFTVTGGVSFHGGALACFFDSAPLIANCRFTGNHATEFNPADPLFANYQSFSGDSGTFPERVEGGAVINVLNFTDDVVPGDSDLAGPLFEDCVFSGNSCAVPVPEKLWSAISAISSALTLERCDILDNHNHPDNFGTGGLGVLGFSRVEVTHSRIAGNSGSLPAVFTVEGPTLRMANCLVAGNAGGGIGCLSSESAILLNCTVTGNSATGAFSGGVTLSSEVGAYEIINSLLWNNSLNGSVEDPFASLQDEGGIVTLTNSLVEGPSGSPAVTAGRLFVAPAPPSLAPTVTGDYRLPGGSPAIDAGDSTVLTTEPYASLYGTDMPVDLAGGARLVGTHPDLGAYEWTSRLGPVAVLHWPLDEGSGTTTTEALSGETEVATLLNGPTWTTGLAPASSHAVAFQETTPGSYIDAGTLQTDGQYVPAASAVDNVVLATEWTITAWIEPSQIQGSTDRCILTSDTDASNWWLFFLGRDLGVDVSSNNLGFDFNSTRVFSGIRMAPSQTVFVSISGNSAADSFGPGMRHRFAVWDGTKWQTKTGSRYAPIRLDGLEIGSFNDGTRQFRGTLDDMRIYDKALTDAELTALALNNTLFGELGGIVAAPTGPTNSPSIEFTVQFTEEVTGFDATDVEVIAGPSVTYGTPVISGSGTEYTVTIDVAGDGPIHLDLIPGAGVQTLSGQPLVEHVASADVVVDNTGPFAVTITPETLGPVTGSTLEFTVVFDEPVTGYDAFDDLVLTTTGTATATGMEWGGSGTTYTVILTGVAGNGELSLAVDTTSDVEDLLGHPIEGSVTSSPVTIDGAPYVVSITPSTLGPVQAGSTLVEFTVVFSEPVTGAFDDYSDMVWIYSNAIQMQVQYDATSPDGMTYTCRTSGRPVDGFPEGSIALQMRVAPLAAQATPITDLDGNPLVSSVTSPAVVFSPTSYQAWALENGLTAGPDFDYWRDADNDGLTNAAEFFRNLNPSVADADQTRQMFHLVEIEGQRYGVLTLACRTDVPYQVVYDGWIRADHSPSPYLVDASDNIRSSTDLQFGGVGPAIIQDTTLTTPAGLPTLDPGWDWYHFRFVDPVTTLGGGFMRWRFVDED